MKNISLVLLVSLFATTSWSQDEPLILHYPSAKMVNEKIHCSLTLEADGSTRFSYEISNLMGAEQDIWVMRILIGSNVRHLSTPEDWTVSITDGAQGITRITWTASDSVFFVHPGETTSGFAFSSNGLPTLQPYYVKGWIELPSIDIEPDSIVGGGDVFETSKAGMTLGPMDPPTVFEPVAFLDTIISYKHQSFQLGWITEEGIVTSLDAKLEAARLQIIADRPSAIQILESFVNELDALNSQGNQITSEAYALLKFNAQYLISKL